MSIVTDQDKARIAALKQEVDDIRASVDSPIVALAVNVVGSELMSLARAAAAMGLPGEAVVRLLQSIANQVAFAEEFSQRSKGLSPEEFESAYGVLKTEILGDKEAEFDAVHPGNRFSKAGGSSADFAENQFAQDGGGSPRVLSPGSNRTH
jgi:hypothetical protein